MLAHQFLPNYMHAGSKMAKRERVRTCKGSQKLLERGEEENNNKKKELVESSQVMLLLRGRRLQDDLMVAAGWPVGARTATSLPSCWVL